MKAARNEPMPRVQVQISRPASVAALPRYSMDTARRIRPNSITSIGRYRVENTAAYQNGKAANIAPTAVISHTSLPSQTGPMMFSSTRRRGSSRAQKRTSMPTPRSKPSRAR